MRGVVVTGTDTGVGKTVVCSLLLAALRGRGRRVRYWKPLQTGCPPDDDTAQVVAWSGIEGDDAAPPAVRLRLPASPLEAAAAQGAVVPLPLPVPWSSGDDAIWVVEGAGGILTPVAGTTLLADAFAAFGLPFLVVARPDVGTLNHSLLTLEGLRRRGLEVAGLVFSRPPTAAVRRAVEALGRPPRVLVVPALERVDAAIVARAGAAWAKEPEVAAFLDATAGGPSARDGGALLRRDAACTWHPYTQHGCDAWPLPVVRARGAWLDLADGRRVLDGISSWWTTLHGHGHPAISAAIADQAARLDHVQFAGATHEPAVGLAERLLRRAPAGLERVFYSDDGSTAVETALKMALAFHARRGEGDRTRFLALEHGYHGDTTGAMSLSDEGPFTADWERLRFPVTRVPVPGERTSVEGAARALEDALRRDGATTAALVVEPLLQGAGGMRVHPPAFLRRVRDLTAAHGVLLVADEVLTGFGRTGACFACGRAGVSPDLLCVGKALTGGTLPLAATLSTGAVWSAFLGEETSRAFLHGHSFTANPIACAAAAASLDLLDDAALARADAIGERLERGLSSLRGLPGVRDVRGIGLVRAVEVEDPGGRGYLADVGRRMREAALEAGVSLRPLGPVLYALPPLCVDDAEVDLLANAMVHAVRAALGARP